MAQTLNVKAWLGERLDNALAIAGTKTGKDRGGWLEDASYFVAAIRRIESLEALLRIHRCNSRSDITVGECIDQGLCACSSAILSNLPALTR